MKKNLLLLTFISLAYIGVGQIISQYIETDSGTEPKGIEIWNNTSSTFDFTTNNLIIEKGVNGATPSEDYTLSSGTLASGEVLVIGTSDLQITTENNGASFYEKPFTFNGDDALVVKYGGTTTDVFGEPDVDPGSEWSGNSVSSEGQNISLISGITTGDIDGWADPSSRFETISTSPSGANGDEGFGIAPVSGGNVSPAISNITQSPEIVSSSEDVNVTADITDSDGTIATAELHWGTEPGNLVNTINMSSTRATYSTDTPIPAQTDGTTVYYEIYATDNEAAETTSAEHNYTVLSDEPSNHVTGFVATVNSSSQITTSWTDAVGSTLPDGYLVKAAIAPANPSAPSDGTVESDETLVKNIAQGAQVAVFTGLNAETQYNFMIWAYTNSGSNIDYKTDGTIPSASATTEAASVVPELIITEVTDPADTYQARFVELYNIGASTIDFDSDTWYISRQTNGGNWEDKQLTGSIAPKETYTLANSNDDVNDDFYQIFGFMANFDFGGSAGNGDDGYFLYKGGDHTTGTLIDAYGVVGLDGTGELWEYENSKAVRKNNVTTPNATWTSSEWNIIPNCNTTSMTPSIYPATTWNGSSAKSNDWGTEGNWDNGLPGDDISVLIPSGLSSYPTISSSFTIEDINIANGATLVGQENLTVNGTIYMKKSFAAYSTTSASDGWYVISSSVNSMTIEGSDFEPGANDDLYEYDENGNIWLNYTGGTFGDANFLSGKGYLVSYETTATRSFEGAAFNGDAISATVVETNTNWNLIGNPYPSKLTYDNINAINISSPKSLNASTGAWDDDITGGEVEVGEGIFVYAEGSSSITFNLDDQTHGSDKKATQNYAFLRANFDNGLSVFARFGTDASASKNYEWQHDARYMYPATSIPYLSTITDDEVMASTYVFNNEEESVIVPLYFGVNSEREITFSSDGNIGYQMAIEDNIDGSITEIEAYNPFVFTALPSDAVDRFNLHLTKSSIIGLDENEELAGVHVYANKRNIYFNADENLTNATLTVYNTIGQVVLTTSVDSGSEIIRMENRGAYIVKVQSDEGSMTEKVIIK